MGARAEGEDQRSAGTIPGEPPASWSGPEECKRKCKTMLVTCFWLLVANSITIISVVFFCKRNQTGWP